MNLFGPKKKKYKSVPMIVGENTPDAPGVTDGPSITPMTDLFNEAFWDRTGTGVLSPMIVSGITAGGNVAKTRARAGSIFDQATEDAQPFVYRDPSMGKMRIRTPEEAYGRARSLGAGDPASNRSLHEQNMARMTLGYDGHDTSKLAKRDDLIAQYKVAAQQQMAEQNRRQPGTVYSARDENGNSIPDLYEGPDGKMIDRRPKSSDALGDSAAADAGLPPPPTSNGPVEGQTATGPNGEKIVYRGGRWVPVNG